ncbi:tetratricopeptide repeat protein [Pedobacter sp. AW31-3R]|uniref:tetratricopeptide repeat protein n=1 Tax=Pedobacter sp. AW31-3R TaxID=3445781 RepID=UPI003F9F25E5
MNFKITLYVILLLISVRLFGQSKTVYEIKVDSLAQAGRLEEIIPYLEREVKKEPKNEMLLRLTGFRYLQVNHLELGEKYYREALVVNPACARCYLNIGRIYASKSDFKQALIYLDKAVIADSSDVLVYCNRAEIYFELENMDASCQDYTKAKMLVQQQGNHDPQLLKRIEEAMLDFCDASKASYYYQRGVAFYNLKQYDKALAIYSSGLLKFPDNAMILSFKGNTYLALKDYKNAEANYKPALANKRGLLVEFEKNPRFAAANRQELLTYYNASVAAIYYSDAACKIYARQFDEALMDINEAIALVPDLPAGLDKETYFNRRGEIYMEINKYELALTDFNQSIQINKKYAVSYINRAIAKVSLLEKVQKSTTMVGARLAKESFQNHLVLKAGASPQKVAPTLRAAVEDCNRGISLDGTIGFSYYVRGQLKKLLADQDYCLDLIKAKNMGIEVEASLLAGCHL